MIVDTFFNHHVLAVNIQKTVPHADLDAILDFQQSLACVDVIPVGNDRENAALFIVGQIVKIF